MAAAAKPFLTRIAPIAVFSAALAWYLATLAPGLLLGDTAILLDNIRSPGLSSHVNYHPLTVLWARLVALLPLGSFEYRANLSSALAGAAAVAVVYAACQSLTGRVLPSLVAASLFAVSHSMWWHSTMIECYACNALLTALTVLLMIRYAQSRTLRALAAAAMAAGLGAFNHVLLGSLALGVMACAAIDAVHARSDGRRRFAWCCAALTAGLLPWLAVLFMDAREYGLSEALRGAFVGAFGGIMLRGELWAGLLDSAYLLFLQFPSPFLVCVVAAPFIVAMRHTLPARVVVGLAVTVGTNVLFFATYNTWDRFAFLLPSFTVAAILAAVPLRWVLPKLALDKRGLGAAAALLWAVSFVLPGWLYSRLAVWGQDPSSCWHRRYDNEYCINTHRVSEYVANPNKRHYRDIEEFAELVFAQLPASAALVDVDSRTYYPLEYLQRYHGRRPDLRLMLVNSWGFSNWGADQSETVSHAQTAYAANSEFYTVTLDHPLGAFFDRARGAPLPFRPHYLDAARWVYRLQTRDQSGPAQALELRPGDMRNIGYRDVCAVEHCRILDQPMREFGTRWLNDDQLFVHSPGPGAAVALPLTFSGPCRKVTVALTTAPDYGMTTIRMSGPEAPDTVDLYTPRVAARTVSRPFPGTPGVPCTLWIRSIGMNPASTGAHAGADWIQCE